MRRLDRPLGHRVVADESMATYSLETIRPCTPSPVAQLENVVATGHEWMEYSSHTWRYPFAWFGEVRGINDLAGVQLATRFILPGIAAYCATDNSACRQTIRQGYDYQDSESKRSAMRGQQRIRTSSRVAQRKLSISGVGFPVT